MRRAHIIVITAAGCAACGLAFGAASWSGQPYSVIIGDHVTAAGQARTGSVVMTLNHDTACTISISVSTGGDEVLSGGGDTLATSYKLTGTALQNGDADWVASAAFLTKSYTVPDSGPSSDAITLWVKAVAAAGRANNAGTYTASIVVTTSW